MYILIGLDSLCLFQRGAEEQEKVQGKLSETQKAALDGRLVYLYINQQDHMRSYVFIFLPQ